MTTCEYHKIQVVWHKCKNEAPYRIGYYNHKGKLVPLQLCQQHAKQIVEDNMDKKGGIGIAPSDILRELLDK